MNDDTNVTIAIYSSFMRNWNRKPTDEPLIKHGIDRWTVELANALARAGARVDVLIKATRIDSRASALFVPGVQLRVVGASRMGSLFGLLRYARRERPGVIIGGMHQANLQLLLLRPCLGARLIATVHEHVSNLVAGMNAREGQRYLSQLAKYRSADGLVTASTGVREDLLTRHGFAATKVHVIGHPVSAPDCIASADQAGLALAQGQRRILGVGRICEQKGFDRLIDAFALIADDPSLLLTICGWGPDDYMQLLHARIREHGLDGRVQFSGHVTQIGCWFRSADVFVLSSRWEAPSLVLIEAMACGTPVVAFDCPSGPAEILDGGRYGALVTDHDIAALARAIRATLDHPGEPRARQERAARYSPANAAKGYLELIRGVIDAGVRE